MVTTADVMVGPAAKEWLERGRALERLFQQLCHRIEGADREIQTAVAGKVVTLSAPLGRGGTPRSPLLVARVLKLEHDPRRGPVELIERRMAEEANLTPVADGVRDDVSALSDALPLAAPTAGRFTWAFRRGAKKAEASDALGTVRACVEAIASTKFEALATHMLAHPPNEPPSTTFAVDPSPVLARAGRALGLRPAGKAPHLILEDDLRAVTALVRHGRPALRGRPALVDKVRLAFVAVQDRMVGEQLAEMPVRTLKDVADGRIRFKSLEEGGYPYVANVLKAGAPKLAAVNGISETTARQLVAAARQVDKAVRDELRFRIDLDRGDVLVTRLIVALHTLLAYDATLAGKGDDLQAAIDYLDPLTAIDRPVRIALFTEGDRAAGLTAEVLRWVSWYRDSGLEELLPRVSPESKKQTAPAAAAWQDFESRSADYYAALGKIVDLKMDDEATVGFMPKEIVDKVHAQALDDSFLRVSLRGYQSFGARYALVQRKVILGDEMGLGKTIQALAVMAHLHAGGKRHFLVVCPASVLINWVREIRAKTILSAFHVHGSSEREHAWSSWQRQGGVAVTTYDTLRALPVPKVGLALLTVDEAHYVKNKATIRAKQILAYSRLAERTLFMTGTPMENRVTEFQQLVDYLQPAVAGSLSATDGVGGGRRFRTKVAPVYLRRNTEDVLAELPALVQAEEWEEFSAEESRAYRGEVRAGHFMGMRRVAFVASPSTSTKLARLKELVDEAAGNGTKVIVFSYFRDVLDVVVAALGKQAIGPLTGSVAAGKRQQFVDEFTRRQGRAVLVSQIQAGGVGLNMQAGSVVILCEPQVKPSLEAQAVARAHRMGQVRTVQVHRLLTSDSVDQRMLEILDSKQQLFDEYARGSDVADLSPEAVDVSEKKLAREVVAAEQERLAQELAAQLEAEYGEG